MPVSATARQARVAVRSRSRGGRGPGGTSRSRIVLGSMTVMLEVVADVRERIFDRLASVDRVRTLRRRTSAVIAHLRGWTMQARRQRLGAGGDPTRLAIITQKRGCPRPVGPRAAAPQPESRSHRSGTPAPGLQSCGGPGGASGSWAWAWLTGTGRRGLLGVRSQGWASA